MSLNDILREIQRIKRVLNAYGLFPEQEEPPFDPLQGVLYPLYTLESFEDAYRILVDLPVADLDTLRVYTEGRDLVIEASLEREVEITTPWSTERKVILRRYKRRITLPPDADTSNVRVRVHPDRKIIEIIVPRA